MAVVTAYLSNNTVPAEDVPRLIETVHQTLSELGPADDGAESGSPEPAVPISESVTPDYIVCLEDGKRLKMLKRHLMAAYNMTPDEYRSRWGLPADYPMIAPNYAKQRSNLAKQIGLGSSGRGLRK